MLTSYLLQASAHEGLQAQNTAGEWIDCPPKDATLVVALGQGLEAITDGVCASTTHRVLSPKAGLGPRYSVPFFQGVSFDAQFESMDVPDAVRQLKQMALEKNGGRKDDVEFTFVKGKWKSLGEATLMNRVRSHPDVGERWVSFFSTETRRLVNNQKSVSPSFGTHSRGTSSPWATGIWWKTRLRRCASRYRSTLMGIAKIHFTFPRDFRLQAV